MTENLNESDNSGPLSDYERMSFEDKIASEKKKKLLVIIILILSIIIIVTITIFLIFYLLKRSSGKEQVICPPGYFNPTDDSTKEICQECSVDNCEKCSGTKLNNICEMCNNTFFPVYEKNNIIICEPICQTGEEDKCLTCNKTSNKCSSCNPFYNLINGICDPNYSFKAIYYTNEKSQKIQLINPSYLDYIIEMTIDNMTVSPQSTYIFSEEGNHTIYALIDISKISSAEKMFFQSKEMTYISFSSKFKNTNITKIDYIFAECSSLISIDFSNFNTRNVTSFNYIFHSCFSLTSINLTNFETINAENMEGMFYHCSKLTSIDMSSFQTNKLKNMKSMFESCTSLISIDLSHFNTENVLNMENLYYLC